MHPEKIWQVHEVNAVVRELLENSLHPFWLEGEVGTLHIHRSGHVYLTLKDSRAQLKAVFFGGASRARQLNLRVGMAVELFGQLTAYEVRGEYQFSIKKLRPVGVGDLQRQFTILKEKLAAEGLFAPERKRPIPILPQSIGVITSPGGAAIRDFLQIIERRFPNIVIKIYPVQVQGQGAAEQIARGIDFFNRSAPVDVLVVTRGGGSMEDLWAFNEEIVARRVAASRIPVISAVGHEIDFTICDFAADLRVPTPSAAAEMVIGRRQEFISRIQQYRKQLRLQLQLKLDRLRARYRLATDSYIFREPLHLLRQKQQLLDEFYRTMREAITAKITAATARLHDLQIRFAHCRNYDIIKQRQLHLNNLRHNLQLLARQHCSAYRAALELKQGRLNNLDPQRVLRRGYAIITHCGKPVTHADIPPGTRLQAQVSDGIIDLIVASPEPDQE